MCRPPAEAELMPDPADTPALPTEAARLATKKPDYSSLPAVTIGRRRRETIACDLARLSAMAVGGHCFKNALASLQPLLQLGAARYGALINSVTHVFMYTHYLWTSFKFKNPFKALLTKWQIAQFYSCFLHAVLVLSGVFVVETKIDKELAWLQFCYHITMVYLFTFQMAWIPKCYVPLDELDDAAPASKKRA